MGPERWDIFCRVVDNYGDVGVSWRLARQIAREHGKPVRLWLDDLTVLAKLRPEVDPARDRNDVEGVEVRRLDSPAGEVADVVVETFGCDPPEPYVLEMARRDPKPRWINLEYLSAEDWVEESHALPSPNPRLPLTKHFFFPGFTPRTGGLLREHSLLARRDEFQADDGAQNAFWEALVGRAPPPGALKVSLFSYAGAPVESLVRACLRSAGSVWLVAAHGTPTAGFKALLEEANAERTPGGRRRATELVEIPFLAQDRYDQLLWSCDVNFVRGEDSFVRAQWAARPFVWNIYPTDDGAHWVKMAAFLARYAEGLDRSQAGTLTSLWEAWNRRGEDPEDDTMRPGLPEAWAGFLARREAFQRHARAWSDRLSVRRDLAAELVDFADNVLVK
jgi:uncharacterized repeat protein (TIGR03837 family)